MAQVQNLDAYERPPAFIKSIYKFYQKLSQVELKRDDGILDLGGGLRDAFRDRISEVNRISSCRLAAACRYLRGDEGPTLDVSGSEVKVYEANNIPGMMPGTTMLSNEQLTQNRSTINPRFGPARRPGRPVVKAAS